MLSILRYLIHFFLFRFMLSIIWYIIIKVVLRFVLSFLCCFFLNWLLLFNCKFAFINRYFLSSSLSLPWIRPALILMFSKDLRHSQHIRKFKLHLFWDFYQIVTCHMLHFCRKISESWYFAYISFLSFSYSSQLDRESSLSSIAVTFGLSLAAALILGVVVYRYTKRGNLLRRSSLI